jgi:site-specific DNA recombinase
MTDLCGIYARVSTAEQAKGYSIEGQLAPCRDYATANQWVVYQEYVDPGYSGTNDKRPAFQAAIQDALAGKFSHLLIHKFDRFARNRLHAITYKALLREKGIDVVSISQPLDPESPVGSLLEGITEVFDEWFSLNLRTETLKGQWRALDEGKWPHIPPMAFREFSTGNYNLHTWADVAYEMGITRNGKKISFAAWSYIFHNQFYIGVMTWKGKEALGKYEPLVDRDTFNKVQEIIKANSQQTRNNQRVYRDYLLRGLVWSDDSNSQMTGTLAKGKFSYYRSQKNNSDHKRHHIQAETLEDQLVDILYGVTVQPDDLDNIAELDDTLRLALKVTHSVGAVYQWLKSEEQRRAILILVVAPYGLRVKGDEIVDLIPNPPFYFADNSTKTSSTEYQHPPIDSNLTQSILWLGVLA